MSEMLDMLHKAAVMHYRCYKRLEGLLVHRLQGLTNIATCHLLYISDIFGQMRLLCSTIWSLKRVEGLHHGMTSLVSQCYYMHAKYGLTCTVVVSYINSVGSMFS